MLYTKKKIKEQVDYLIADRGFEDACFLIIEGLSLLDENGVEEYDFTDDEVIELMEL